MVAAGSCIQRVGAEAYKASSPDHIRKRYHRVTHTLPPSHLRTFAPLLAINSTNPSCEQCLPISMMLPWAQSLAHLLLSLQTTSTKVPQPTMRQNSLSCMKASPPDFLIPINMDAMALITMTMIPASGQLRKSCIRFVESRTEFHGRHLLSPSWNCANVSRIMELR